MYPYTQFLGEIGIWLTSSYHRKYPILNSQLKFNAFVICE